ncbi:MAG: hypothetical protein ACFFBP_21085 [Promethearchaeota archaeon]
MARINFYRYISDDEEKRNIIENRQIKTLNKKVRCTWFTTHRYETSEKAKNLLALPLTPKFRIGPIPVQNMPELDKIDLRPVAPAYEQPGGGIEACARDSLDIFGLYNFSNQNYEL